MMKVGVHLLYCLIGFFHFGFCPFCVVLGINERNGGL